MLKSKMLKAGWIGLSSMIFMISPSVSSTAKEIYHRAPVFNFADSLGKLTDSTAENGNNLAAAQENEELSLPQIRLNASARKYVLQFIPKNREDLEVAEKRSERYFSIIEPIFEKQGIPVELKYLAVVESQLNTKARSKVGARGLWQFMPQTARELGLKCHGNYDERTHAYKSTVAAAKYLKALHAQFGDWLLVIAAYNSGPGYVYNAIKKSGSRNFWKMQRYLPGETRSHVKRFIGTHIYFQDEASITVLTKAETLEHLKAVEAHNMKRKMNNTEEVVVQVQPQAGLETKE